MSQRDLFFDGHTTQRIAGVDEAGRGPLAGPVIACALILDPHHIPTGIDDSKQLSSTKRDSLYEALMATAQIGIGVASAQEIDSINILQATMLAMTRAVEALAVMPDLALVDGNRLPRLPCPAQAIIGGDASHLCIAAASIIAKVTRDRMMCELAKEFPYYGWERNAGYGTAMHLDGLARHGVTPHHRRSFAPVRSALEKQVAYG